jgi:RNA polymerase sigma-70 factor (sigma-E family)
VSGTTEKKCAAASQPGTAFDGPWNVQAETITLERGGPGMTGSTHDELCAALFAEHFRGLVVLADLLGADDAENVVQEAFLRLHAARSRLRDAVAAHAYLRRIVINLTRTRVRHLQMARTRGPLPDPPADGPEDLAVSRSDGPIVVQALHRLAPRYREALVLRYWMSLPEKEIARLMGVSAGTVKSHLSRGLDALRTLLEEHVG